MGLGPAVGEALTNSLRRAARGHLNDVLAENKGHLMAMVVVMGVQCSRASKAHFVACAMRIMYH